MKALVKIDDVMVYDIVADGATFETSDDFVWVNIDPIIAGQSGLEYNPTTKTINIVHKFIPGGKPSTEKEIKLREAVVEFEGHMFQADSTSQDALSRNILADQETFFFLDAANVKVELDDPRGKQLLKLMTDKTLQIIEEYQARKDELLAQGFTKEDLGLLAPEENIPADA